MPTVAQAVQSAHGPLRAGGYHVKYLLRLDDAESVPARSGAGVRAAVRCNVQGLSTATKAVELQRRPGDAAIDPGARRMKTASCSLPEPSGRLASVFHIRDTWVHDMVNRASVAITSRIVS